MSRLFALFWGFFSISSVALGGGLAMLPIMGREFVEKRHWMTDDDMVDTVAVMQSMPGIISINMGVLIGYRVAGVLGAVVSVFGVVLSPFVIILVLAMFLDRIAGNAVMDHVFLGVRASVAAMILLSAIKLGKQIVKNWLSATIAFLGFVCMVFFELNAILLIIVAAVIGIAMAYIPRRKADIDKATEKQE